MDRIKLSCKYLSLPGKGSLQEQIKGANEYLVLQADNGVFKSDINACFKMCQSKLPASIGALI